MPTSQSIQTRAAAPRILVVDDMPDNLFLMNGLLEDRYQVVEATSGREALDIVMSDAPPDMVLLDIMMPDMDGYEVLRRIRQHAPTATIPVIFLTALASQQDQRLGLDLGAIDYVTKPVDPEKIIQRVEAHVRATLRARRVEELSERLSRHFSAAAWDRLFHGPGLAGIRFEQKPLTLLYAETALMPHHGAAGRDTFTAEVDWLVARHGGDVDPFAYGAVLAYFNDPHACVRMAMELQRSCPERHLRIGVHTGTCVVATFECEGFERTALLGPETGAAARAAQSAATGSIVITAQTYALVQEALLDDPAGCLLTEEFHDSDLAQACLTPAPLEMSSFAGLGLT